MSVRLIKGYKDRSFHTAFLGSFCLGLALVWWFQAAHPLLPLTPDDTLWYSKIEMASECRFGKLVFLGDSRPALSINPEVISPEATNLAIAASGPMDAYFIAKTIVDCPHPPQAVVLSFANSHFLGNWGGDYEIFLRMARYGHYSFADLEDIRTHMRYYQLSLLGKERHADLEQIVMEMGSAIHFPPYMMNGIGSMYRLTTDAGTQHYFDAMYHHQGAFPADWPGYRDSHINKATLSQYDHIAPPPFFEHYFDALLTLLESRHIPIYFITIPVSRQVYDTLKPGFLADYPLYLQRYAQRHPGLHILIPDFMILPADLFRDADHANEKGARVWSEQLRNIINDARIEGGPYMPLPGEGRNGQ